MKISPLSPLLKAAIEQIFLILCRSHIILVIVTPNICFFFALICAEMKKKEASNFFLQSQKFYQLALIFFFFFSAKSLQEIKRNAEENALWVVKTRLVLLDYVKQESSNSIKNLYAPTCSVWGVRDPEMLLLLVQNYNLFHSEINKFTDVKWIANL